MAEHFAFTVTYVEAELNSAVRNYLLRSLVENTWTSYVAIFAVVIGAGLAMFGRRLDFLTGFFIGLLLAAVLMLGLIVKGSFQRKAATLAAMKTPKATFKLSDEGVLVETGDAFGRYGWERIKQIWKFDRIWLLMFSANQFLTLPVAEVSAEALAFLESKVQPRRL